MVTARRRTAAQCRTSILRKPRQDTEPLPAAPGFPDQGRDRGSGGGCLSAPRECGLDLAGGLVMPAEGWLWMPAAASPSGNPVLGVARFGLSADHDDCAG